MVHLVGQCVLIPGDGEVTSSFNRFKIASLRGDILISFVISFAVSNAFLTIAHCLMVSLQAKFREWP